MAEWELTNENRKHLKELISNSSISSKNVDSLKEISKKEIINYNDLTHIKESLPDDAPVCVFFSKLKLHHQNNTYKASEEFRRKTEQLRVKQEQDEYKNFVKNIDPAQKYGRTSHIENFGTEMRTVNRQMISIINVVITVVGAFFFGFSGVTYAYPHLKLDLPTRFIIGLVPATIVFFADLYFVVKSMDMDEESSGKAVPETFSFKNMEQKKND